ncbi:MAG: protoheme IX farnesyltransferase [Gammaproteobacteria bacterium RIFCSPHIGHO2_12_FULL_45_9]|nr:MAG: protoheme IX farnesyltransferase [Gammaproteobacteria bacterium RIFCSPHIGHO2_12_FULL_45_9]
MSECVVTQKAVFWDYLELCKPRVVLLMIITAIVGMCLAVPGSVPLSILWWGNVGIALAAGSAATINHVVEQKLDRLMQRTLHRPVAEGRVTTVQALIFATILAALAMWILVTQVNGLTALLTFASLMGYALVYTVYLKHATVQNIVIGGAAGAAPPLLGWVAVTGHLDAGAWLLMMIIFVWTPPHFWALAIHRLSDYEKSGLPMLPVRYGVPFTKLCILLYTMLLSAVTLLPVAIGMSHGLYFVGVLLLNVGFLYHAIRLWRSDDAAIPMKVFRFSISYLFMLFILLLIDHYYEWWL